MSQKTVSIARTPEKILQLMDKDGARGNLPFLIQLNAELLVSLSNEADKVSSRNLNIAKISCGIGVLALIISLVQVFAASH